MWFIQLYLAIGIGFGAGILTSIAMGKIKFEKPISIPALIACSVLLWPLAIIDL